MISKSIIITVTGPIGCGKSSICEAVIKERTYTFIPEYIDMNPPAEFEKPPVALLKWASGQMNLFDFQSYILELTRWYLAKNWLSGIANKVCIIESAPAIANEVFAVAGLVSGKITQKELTTLRVNADRLSQTFGLPRVNYNDGKWRPTTRIVHVSVIHGDFSQTKKNILAAIDDHLLTYPADGLIIALDGTVEELTQRIQTRGRDGEQHYSDEYISDVRQRYRDLLT
jgi:deoxyadenosine/deoxycytidine kinase